MADGRIAIRDEEIDRIRQDDLIEERAKSEKMKSVRYESIADVLEEVDLIDTHFYVEFFKTKTSLFLKGSWKTRI